MRIPFLTAAAALAMLSSAAHADIVALIPGNVLTMIDSQSGKVTGKTKIQGLGPVVGIDVRPSDGQLYALAADGTVATVDAKTGAATVKSKLETMPQSGASVTVDFNPVADKMRVIGSDGSNLRANVDDGKVTTDKPLKFADGDKAAGKTPAIVAGGYTNSMKGAKETTLYDIDGKLGTLFRQAPPNDGVLSTIGALGVSGKGAGFDIMSDGAGGNTAMLVLGKTLHMIDLATGKTTASKPLSGLPGEVADIAYMPAL